MPRILVIDSSAIVSMAVRSILELDGHQVRWLGRFDELSACLNEFDPDLILLGLIISGLPASQYSQAIRNNFNKKIPILLHSSQTSSELESIIKETGAAGVIPKGIEYKEQMRQTITKLFKGSMKFAS